MSKNTSPFVLERLLFVRNVVIAMQGFNPDKATPPDAKNNIDVRADERDRNLYLANMRTMVNAEQSNDYPYSIDMECVCSLRVVEEGLDDATLLRGATITAHSMLYGAIREATSWITGRQPWGPFTLGISVLQSAPPKDTVTTET